MGRCVQGYGEGRIGRWDFTTGYPLHATSFNYELYKLYEPKEPHEPTTSGHLTDSLCHAIIHPSNSKTEYWVGIGPGLGLEKAREEVVISSWFLVVRECNGRFPRFRGLEAGSPAWSKGVEQV